MNATQKELQAKMLETCRKQTTENLIYMAHTFNKQDSDDVIVAEMQVLRALEERMTEAQFLELMKELDAELDAA